MPPQPHSVWLYLPLSRGSSHSHVWGVQNEVVSNHDELMCNFFAQADALANGKSEIELRSEQVNYLPLPDSQKHTHTQPSRWYA